jgi:hypothetical protein
MVMFEGWGFQVSAVNPRDNPSEELYFIDLNVISNTECRLRLMPLFGISLLIQENRFCTLNGREEGVCYGKHQMIFIHHFAQTFISGDSGSGIIANGQLVGVVSSVSSKLVEATFYGFIIG